MSDNHYELKLILILNRILDCVKESKIIYPTDLNCIPKGQKTNATSEQEQQIYRQISVIENGLTGKGTTRTYCGD